MLININVKNIMEFYGIVFIKLNIIFKLRGESMSNLIKLEFKRVFKSKNFYLALLISFILIGIVFYPLLEWKNEYDYVTAWLRSISMGKSYITLLFPLIVAIPYSYMLATEKKNNFFKYILVREDRRKYLISKAIVNAISGGLILLIPSIILLILCIINFGNPFDYPDVFRNYVDPFSVILKTNPLAYILMHSFWMFLQGMIWSTVCFAISLVSNNILLITAAPFLYHIINNFVLAILGMARFNTPNSFSPYLMSNTTLFTMMVQPIALIIFIICMTIYYRKSRENIYD